jgi:hypothetical protein
LSSGAAHTTLPWSWYSDPQTLPREQERIFRRAWRYAGPAEQAASAGGYFSTRVGDVPVLEGGQLLPESERLLAHFQKLVREALA